MKLAGKVAIVTGGDTGIGRGLCLKLAREGASVVVDYRGDASPAKELVREIEGFNGLAYAVRADVTKPEDVDALVRACVERYGALDIAVNNAAFEEQHGFIDMPLDVYHRTVAVNLTGVWMVTQAAVKQMIALRSGGRVVNISSVHEDIAMPTNAAYCATKGALRMLARTLCVELAQFGITVNNICPGAIDTPNSRRDPQDVQTLVNEIPQRRLGTPDDVAAMLIYLASDDAAYVTGASLFVDGGMSKQSGSL